MNTCNPGSCWLLVNAEWWLVQSKLLCKFSDTAGWMTGMASGRNLHLLPAKALKGKEEKSWGNQANQNWCMCMCVCVWL